MMVYIFLRTYSLRLNKIFMHAQSVVVPVGAVGSDLGPVPGGFVQGAAEEVPGRIVVAHKNL